MAHMQDGVVCWCSRMFHFMLIYFYYGILTMIRPGILEHVATIWTVLEAIITL